jgi:hypothetical protein
VATTEAGFEEDGMKKLAFYCRELGLEELFGECRAWVLQQDLERYGAECFNSEQESILSQIQCYHEMCHSAFLGSLEDDSIVDESRRSSQPVQDSIPKIFKGLVAGRMFELMIEYPDSQDRWLDLKKVVEREGGLKQLATQLV